MPLSGDIRAAKAAFRDKYRRIRSETEKQECLNADAAILQKLTSMWAYRDCQTLFTYVSVADEVDTLSIIELSLKKGKSVAVPRCVDGKREMEFYFIDSLNELEKRSYGIPEPDARADKLVTNFSAGLCLVPALVFDSEGYRLGYGKGYYDRFLSSFGGYTVGLCRSECLCAQLPKGRYDRNVNAVLTEKRLTIIR